MISILAVDAVSAGKAFVSPAISKMLAEEYLRQMREHALEDSYDLLTTREREVLQCFRRGQAQQESWRPLAPHRRQTGALSDSQRSAMVA